MYKDSCDKLREQWQGSCGKIRLRVCARLYRCAEEAKEKEEEEEQKNDTDKASQQNETIVLSLSLSLSLFLKLNYFKSSFPENSLV